MAEVGDTPSPTHAEQHEPLVSVVISTFNRADSLRETLTAFADQDISYEDYEVIVVDDGSTDHTWTLLQDVSTPYPLRIIHHKHNHGVSAGRNAGIRIARGRNLVLVSDDILVSPDFLWRHVDTLERMLGHWVVGAFRQRDSLSETPFGRYLEELEGEFQQARTSHEIAPGLFEMTWPTARNLSLRRADLQQVGLFDERFRTCCEDQDLAVRARRAGVRFVYNTEISCVHNDQTADLARYCRFQELGARDTVALCAKSPELFGSSKMIRVNGPISRADGIRLALKKLAKLILARPAPSRGLNHVIAWAEQLSAPDMLLRRGYRLAISLAIFRGWRVGIGAEIADELRH